MRHVAICCYSTLSAVVHYLGVVVAANSVRFPRPLVSTFPFLVVWRDNVAISNVAYLKSLGNWFGFEAVDMTMARECRILLPDREARLAFFRAIRAVRSDIAIYRWRY